MGQEHDREYRRRYRLNDGEILYRIRLIELDGIWRVEAHRLDPSDRATVIGEVDAWEFGSEDVARDFVAAFLDEKHGAVGDQVD